MTDADIQTAIITLLKSIKGIGHVWPYEPFYRQAHDLAAQYMIYGKIRGWSVTRDALVELPATIGTLGLFQNVERVTWRIVGMYECDESGASALDFNNLIDQIRDLFRDNRSLNMPGINTVFEERAGIELTDIGLASFCGEICHTAVLALTTERHH